MNSDRSSLPRRSTTARRFGRQASVLLCLLAQTLMLQQAVQAECTLCGKKLIHYNLHLDADSTVELTYGVTSGTAETKSYVATGLPRHSQGYIKIDMNAGGVPVTTSTAGEMKNIEVKAELKHYLLDRYVGANAEFATCGVQMEKPYLSLWHHQPPDPTQPPTCTCVTGMGGGGGGGGGGSSTPSDPVDAHWENVGTFDGYGYPTEAEAAAALAALQANDTDVDRHEGSVSAVAGDWGFSGFTQHWVEATEGSGGGGGGGGGGDGGGGGGDEVSPYCPVHGSMGPPDPGTPPPEPPANQTTDSLTIKIEVPGTGSGGNDGDGGGGVGMLGEGGLSIQPSPPAGSEEEPQLLPLSWVWDLGSDASGNPVGTLAFITDLTAANPLDLAKFSTRAGQPGGLTVTALPAGQTGWQVEAATAPSIRLQIVQVDAATVEVRRFKLGVDPAGTPGVVHRFELTTVSGLPGIRHTEITGTSSQVKVDAGTAPATGGRTWRMAAADGTVRDGTESPWANDQQTTEETLSTNSGATFQQRTVTLRVKKPWGVEVVEERVYDSDAAGAVPVVTSHVFYESAADAANYGKLKWRSSTDGSWEKFIYLPGGETRSYRPWRDGPADPQSATAANSRTTLTSADGQTVTESIAGQIVSITQSGSMAGIPHPHFWSVPMAEPDPNNPDAPPQPMPEYYGSNLLDNYTCSYTLRQLPGQGGASLTSQHYVNNRTGRTDFIQDESGAVSVYEEFPASLVIAGANIAVTKRIRMRDLQSWAEGAPATTAPLQEVEYFDSKDRLLKKELLDAAGSAVSTTDYVYDGTTTRQTQVVQDGATVYDWQTSTDNEGNRVEIETDAHGGKTRTVTSPDGETVTRSKLAVDGTTALLTTTTSKNGLTETTTTTGGGLTRTSVVTRDAQGRTTQQVDEEGVTTNYEYQDGGRTVIEKDVANNVLKTTRQYLDGQLKSVEGPAVVAEYHDYAAAEGGLITETVRYGAAAGTLYRKRVANGLGQLLQEIEPPQDGGAAEKITQHAYDAQGRLETTQVTGMAPMKLIYDGLGRAAVQRVLLGAGGTESADDPLTTRTTGYETAGGALWEVSTTSQATDGSTAHDLITTQKRQLGTGPDTVQTSTTPDGSITTQSTVVNRATATVTTTTSSSRATRTVTRIMINGLVQSETSLTVTTATSYTYDGLERLSTVATPEGVVHKTVYDDTTAGIARSRVKEQQLKPAGGSAFVTQASHAYYPLGAAQEGRLQTLTNAENATTTYTYDAAGRVLTQTGTASYPLRYQYDTLGRLWKLHTYRAASPNLTQAGDVTTWVYDPASGKLTGKLDAANHGPSYTYTAGGLLHTRTWERGVVTTYAYDGAGRLTGVDYSDTTPDVAHGYDRAGRRTSTTDAAGEHTLTYDGSQLDTWTVGGTGKAWSGLSVDYGVTAGRRSGREAALGAITVPAVSYAYAASSGALESVSTAGAGSTTVKATYRSTATTGWNEGVTYSVGTSTKLSSTRTPDTRGRLDAVSWANGSNAVLSGHDYTLDAMNRRTAALRQDGSSWSYGYNLRGEVTSAVKEDATHIPEPGKQYGFAFDGLGNRTSSTVSSLADNEVLRSTGYTANAVNQYTEITHPQPGWLVLRGRVNAQSSVTIDGNAPTLLFGEKWHHEQSVDNSAGAVRRVAEVTATRPDGGTNNAAVTARHKGALFIPPPVEVVTHDDDGNQTSNAHWSYTWDGENRLIAAEESLAILLQPPGSGPVKRQRIECAYDAQGRRIYKRVLTAEGMSTNFVLKQSVVFLYEGWNMIAEIDTTTSARLIRSYEWGLDVSGTFYGAGGVGGLLVERVHSGTTSTTVNNSQPPSTGVYAPCYDGNGNVMELVNLATGGVSARYEYGAFGETISVDGDAIADANPFRFSTKYLDAETGLLYYGFRYYSSETGRWINRDPIGELGGMNLQGILSNDTLNGIDVLGLSKCEKIKKLIDRTSKQLGDVQAKIRNIEREIQNKRIPDLLTNPGSLPWSIPGAKPSQDVRGHIELLHKLLKIVENYKDYEKALKAEKAVLWIAYNGCIALEKMRQTISKHRGIVLRFAKKGVSRIPIVLILTFAFDSATAGVPHAFNEATWPISLIWTCGSSDEDDNPGPVRPIEIDDGLPKGKIDVKPFPDPIPPGQPERNDVLL